MMVLEYKAVGKLEQYHLIDNAIQTAQFIRNKTLKFWMNTENTNKSISRYDLNNYCTALAREFEFTNKLNSQARQASAERAWSSISRFYKNCKNNVRPVGFPRFKKNCRSVEYKTQGWRLDALTKRITFIDGFGIGTLRLKGTYDLTNYPKELIKRIRIIRRADGYYVQFVIKADRNEPKENTDKAIGLDVGLASFYTDSNGHKEDNPQFYKKSEKKLKRLQKRVSKKHRKGEKQSNNYKKAKNRLARQHLKISRQRKDRAVKLARCVVASNDLVAYEDLSIANMVKNHKLAKSINDASWYQFREWIEYYGKVFGKVVVAVPPEYTSQDCSNCGTRVEKTLSTRTHVCPECKVELDRDENAAINILLKALSTVGHTGIYAWGEDIRPHSEANFDEPRIFLVKECQTSEKIPIK